MANRSINNNFAVSILLEQLREAHENLEGTLAGVTDQIAAFKPKGKANPIAGTYAHLAMSEDFFIRSMLQGKKPLFASTWKDKTGADSLQPTEWQTAYPKWLRTVKVDVAQLNKYYKAVSKASEKYLATLSDEDLKKDVDMSAFGMGKRKVSTFFHGFIIGHANSIMGELSVLKGIQDLKGYPF